MVEVILTDGCETSTINPRFYSMEYWLRSIRVHRIYKVLRSRRCEKGSTRLGRCGHCRRIMVEGSLAEYFLNGKKEEKMS